MKKTLTVACFNTQNPNMKKEKQTSNSVQELIQLIQQENIDILCCQEMLKESIDVLKQELPAYQIVGKYRYGESIFINHLEILKKYNEATPIITNQKILTTKNYHLPWLPKRPKELKQGLFKYRSITPRILTEALLKITNEYTLKVMNTHLEKRLPTIKKAQLKRIKQVITTSTYPVIVMGDFNMGIDNSIFQEFTKELSNYHLKRVDIATKTWKAAKKEIAIDHIFIPENYQVLEQKIKNNTMSDHYMIIVKIALEI